MGYITSYSLKIEDMPKVTKSNEEIIEDLRFNSSGAEFCLDQDGSSLESSKWYDHEQDLLALSRRYPEKLFILSGEGEEPGDIWKKYFCFGKMQEAKAKITVEDFDPGKLR